MTKNRLESRRSHPESRRSYTRHTRAQNSGRGEVFTFKVEMSPANPHLFMCLVDAFVYGPFILQRFKNTLETMNFVGSML
jgi:hypothetical protein